MSECKVFSFPEQGGAFGGSYGNRMGYRAEDEDWDEDEDDRIGERRYRSRRTGRYVRG